MTQHVTLALTCEIHGTPEGFRTAFDNWLRKHTRPEDELYELNKSILDIRILDAHEVTEDEA
jgi:hypothetical protein